MVKNLPAMQVGKIHWRQDRLPTPVFLGFPGGLAGKKSTCSVRDLGSTPGLGRFPGEGYPLQYSGLENSMYSPWGRKESDTTERLPLYGKHKASICYFLKLS